MTGRGEEYMAESVERSGNSEVLDRRLDQLIGRFGELADMLECRLEPILLSDRPEKVDSTSEKETGMISSPMFSGLFSQVRVLEQMERRLAGLMARIDL